MKVAILICNTHWHLLDSKYLYKRLMNLIRGGRTRNQSQSFGDGTVQSQSVGDKMDQSQSVGDRMDQSQIFPPSEFIWTEYVFFKQRKRNRNLECSIVYDKTPFDRHRQKFLRSVVIYLFSIVILITCLTYINVSTYIWSILTKEWTRPFATLMFLASGVITVPVQTRSVMLLYCYIFIVIM